MKKEYTQAVLEMISEDKPVQTVLSGLSKTMQSRGHAKLYAPVLQAVLRTLEAKTVLNQPIVTVASEKDVTTYKEAIKEALAQLSTEEKPVTEVDDTMIGGFTAQYNNTRIDQSYKGRLASLYRKLAK